MNEAALLPVPLGDLRLEKPDFWLRPVGLLTGTAARQVTALPLAGGPLAFSAAELLARRRGEITISAGSLDEVRRWAQGMGPVYEAALAVRLAALSEKRPPWAGLALDRPLVMGILNVTPDSFSDGGAFLAPEDAIARAHALLAAGADIIDIGGESTRPHAAPVAPEDEITRVKPVLRALAEAGAVVSIDTRHTSVMAMALGSGARIVNDVTALTGDPASLGIVARAGAAVVLMHMQGEPRTMQDDPRYALASLDVVEYLAGRVAAARAGGIAAANIVVDPGIGFGKTREHNLEILARIALFHGVGTGVMVGISRKSLVGGKLSQRLPGSLAGALHAASQGVQILRVHDVAETRQALAFARAIGV